MIVIPLPWRGAAMHLGSLLLTLTLTLSQRERGNDCNSPPLEGCPLGRGGHNNKTAPA